jgi:hypothetical protein
MDENIKGGNSTTESSEGSSKSARIVAAGLAVAGALTPKDAVSAMTVDNYDSNTAPVVETTGKTSEEMYSTPGIEAVREDQMMPSVQEIDPITEKGGIVFPGIDYEFMVVSPLGAYGPDGTYYPNALPEGGIISIGGVEAEVTYNTGYFPEGITFLNFPSGEGLEAGQVFPYMAFVPYNRAFRGTNFAENHQGSKEKTVYSDSRKGGVSYVVMPIVVSGRVSTIFPPDVENGKIIEGPTKSLKLAAKGITTDTSGGVDWLFCSLSQKEDGKVLLKVEAILINDGSGAGVYMDPQGVPIEMASKLRSAGWDSEF